MLSTRCVTALGCGADQRRDARQTLRSARFRNRVYTAAAGSRTLVCTAAAGSEQPHVVVVGAGWGGWGAAKALAEAGVRVTLLDAGVHFIPQAPVIAKDRRSCVTTCLRPLSARSAGPNGQDALLDSDRQALRGWDAWLLEGAAQIPR